MFEISHSYPCPPELEIKEVGVAREVVITKPFVGNNPTSKSGKIIVTMEATVDIMIIRLCVKELKSDMKRYISIVFLLNVYTNGMFCQISVKVCIILHEGHSLEINFVIVYIRLYKDIITIIFIY